MKRINKILDRGYYKINGLLMCNDKLITLKKCGGKEVIMEFALGAVAIVLAILFRNQLQTVLSTIGKTFNDKIQAMFTSI